MQRDMFMAQMITRHGVPHVELPVGMSILEAERVSPTEIRAGDIAGTGEDPAKALCVALVALGVPQQFLQVYDGTGGGRVACFFMSIKDIASS